MIVLTDHAVSQYISRYNREMKFDKAKSYLEKQLTYAKKLGERSLKGQELWELPNGACLVTKKDGSEDIVVTILKERSDGISDEEIELVMERLKNPPPPPEILTNDYSYSISLNIKFQYKLPVDQDSVIMDEKLHKGVMGAINGLIKNFVDIKRIDSGEVNILNKARE